MMRRSALDALITATLFFVVSTVAALEPPTAAQLERYRNDGSLARRIDAARSFGNHRMAPELAARFVGAAPVKAKPDRPKALPASGSPEILTLLIAFEDMAGVTDPAVVEGRIFGDGEPSQFPYESLTAFYSRSSFGRLSLGGSVLGWYTAPYPRSQVVESTVGRQNLIKEAITHFDNAGHDFSRYDNDGDGVIDYLAVIWTGPRGDWAEFWWGYQTRFWNDHFTVDGVEIGTYSWQWENASWPGEFSPEVLIHETGHALGLPDYYDYDDAIGPRGGVGGLDQMAGNWGDHNGFSKWVLGWLEPQVYNQGDLTFVLSPTDLAPSAAVLMHGDPVTDPFAEYFLVQVRRPEGNDAELPNQGVLIWHVDARLGDDGGFLFDNSYTEHKLLRLMEADGLEEIEQGGRADAGDFYQGGDVFDTTSTPSSHRYDGVPTNVAIQSISLSWAGPDMMLTVDLGSGCALWCDASVTATAWPGVAVDFNGSLTTANCSGAPSFGWTFGDGGSSGDTDASHTYVSTGSYPWSVTATLDDATCAHQGLIRVCTEFPCWQWTRVRPMHDPRARHSSVALDDGRVMVVGGGPTGAEIYDPATDTWSIAAQPPGDFVGSAAVRLDGGQVLVVGADPANPHPAVTTGLYDPSADAWFPTGQLTPNRWDHSALELDDGRVLVVGGSTGEWPNVVNAASIEVFDPGPGVWSQVASVERQLIEPGLTKLEDGQVLIVGGRELTVLDPNAGTLTRVAPLPGDWQRPITATLGDGRVLIASPADSTRTLLWRPSDGRWDLVGDLNAIRRDHTTTLLPSGRVLLAGGRGTADDWLDTVELFDPAAGEWIVGASLRSARGAHAACVTTGGRVFVTGGYGPAVGGGSAAMNDVELLAPHQSPPRRSDGRVYP